MRLRPLFEGAPQFSTSVLVAFVAAHAALKLLFFSGPFVRAGVALHDASGGLLTPVMLAGLVEWLVLIGGLAVCAGRLRPRHLGIDQANVGRALVALAALWVAGQTLAAGGSLLVGTTAPEDVALAWLPFYSAGRWLEAVLGSGLVEEVLYRGVLLPQVYFLARWRGLSSNTALVGAAVGTSLYFGLNHVPAALGMTLPPFETALYLLHVVLAGLLFAALYVRSGNILVAAGAHALVNSPVVFVPSPLDPALLILVAACALVLGWPWLSRRFEALFEYGALEGRAAF